MLFDCIFSSLWRIFEDKLQTNIKTKYNYLEYNALKQKCDTCDSKKHKTLVLCVGARGRNPVFPPKVNKTKFIDDVYSQIERLQQHNVMLQPLWENETS